MRDRTPSAEELRLPFAVDAAVEADQAAEEARPRAGMAEDEDLGKREAPPDVFQVLWGKPRQVGALAEPDPAAEEPAARLALQSTDHARHRSPSDR